MENAALRTPTLLSVLLSIHVYGWAVARNGTINHTHNGGELPMVYSLLQNYPNPFNPITTIRYQIPELSFVTLKVFDVLGGEIATLVKEEKPAGEYEVDFDATGLPSEIYFYKLKAGSFMQTKKMILLR